MLKKILCLFMALVLCINTSLLQVNAGLFDKKDYVVCGVCDNIISKQKGFKKSDHIWMCEECGMVVIDDTVYAGERFPNTIWICDECNAWLNTQTGFNDMCGTWECLNCHYNNEISVLNMLVPSGELKKVKDDSSEEILDGAYCLKGHRYKTKNNYGETVREELKENDLHYGWSLGDFYATGYTSVIRPGENGNSTCIFLKNPEDEIEVFFKLKQDIEALNGNLNLVINSVENATDSKYEIKGSNFGLGTLISQQTNSKNEVCEPIQYNDYLKGVSNGSNTKIEPFEEGDYKCSLDYTIKKGKNIPLVGKIASPLSHYRIDFEFKVRNGNCMAYPKDLKTNVDLMDNAITENGFYIDLAKSKYLNINVEYFTVESKNGRLYTDEKYSEPANQNKKYTQTGIYVIHVENPTTNKTIEKRICVGKDKNTIKYFNSDFDEELKDDDFVEDDIQVDVNVLNDIQFDVYKTLLENDDLKDNIVSDVKVFYASDEYLKNLKANSKENRYFGYTLSEINEYFGDKKYVFAVGENNETIVKEFIECNEDEIYEKVIKDVAIGTGVILVCVTTAAVASHTLPAVSMIFSVSAKEGAKYAINSAVIPSIISGTVTMLKTGDIKKVKTEMLKTASTGFKWGAIAGSTIGGVKEFVALNGAVKKSNEMAQALALRTNDVDKIAMAKGLSMNEIAMIQRESKYPLDVISSFTSMEQYNICKKANLVPKIVNGKVALVRQIDLDFKDEFGIANKIKMEKGNAPLDPLTGKTYELHHIGQNMDSTLAILTKEEHMQGGNNKIWHEIVESSIDRSEFKNIKENFWKEMVNIVEDLV